MNYEVKLSKRFYALSFVTSLLIAVLIALPLADLIAKEQARSAVQLSTYTDQQTARVDYTAYDTAYAAAKKDAYARIAPYLSIGTLLFFLLAFIVVGRHRQPVRFDADGVEVWNWFGRKRHRWSDLRNRSTIRVRSTGLKAAAFEQFHFTTGTASVNTRRLDNGNEVLAAIEELLLRGSASGR